MTHEQLVEGMARSDAEFDGRDWEGMGRADRDRYKARCTRSLAVVYEAVKEPDAEELKRLSEPSPFIENAMGIFYRRLLAASPLNPVAK